MKELAPYYASNNFAFTLIRYKAVQNNKIYYMCKAHIKAMLDESINLRCIYSKTV